MFVFLVSLAVLFVSLLVGYAYLRSAQDVWPPAGTPETLPWAVWAGPGTLIRSSVTAHRALRSVRGDDLAGLRRWLAITFGLGWVFLGLQAYSAYALSHTTLVVTENLLGFLLYAFAVLHGLHLIGGLIPLGVTLRRAAAGRYTASSHHGVQLCALYWHFLDAVWLVVLCALWVP